MPDVPQVRRYQQAIWTLRRLLLARASDLEIGTGVRIDARFYHPRGLAVRLGPEVRIKRDVRAGWEAGHAVERRDGPVLEAPIEIGPVEIGDDVMIYSDVVILPGVTIGDGAVVGIRSVVTKDVDPYAMVAGVPAERIGQRD